MDLKPFTVLLLRPDDHWDGPQADWVLREHVDAPTVQDAIIAATSKVIATYYCNDRMHDEFAPIAVYPGHIVDLFDPNGD